MRSRSLWHSEALIVAVSLSLVALVPYTKVEESFNLHAIRDFVKFGPNLQQLHRLDHATFPGAVPRSFVPAIIFSAVTSPVVFLGSCLQCWRSEMDIQLLIRAMLALLNSASLIYLARRVRSAFGYKTAKYLLWITATQFHLMFWLSRTLPNSFAFPLAQVAFGLLIFPRPAPPAARSATGPKASLDIIIGFVLLTFAAVVIRLELVTLIAPLALDVWLRKTISLKTLVSTGVGAAIPSLILTVGVDSVLWSELLWPEGSAVWFNVLEGHSVEWGTSPWYTYFFLTLPRILHVAFPLSISSMCIDRRARRIGLPALAYVATLSILKHKEWRFLICVIPLFNICAAQAIQAAHMLFSKRLKRLLILIVISLNLVSLVLGTYASKLNYPGGHATAFLAEHLLQQRGQGTDGDIVRVYVDSHAAMTGASNFALASLGPRTVDDDDQMNLATIPPVSAASFTVRVSKMTAVLLGTENDFEYKIVADVPGWRDPFESELVDPNYESKEEFDRLRREWQRTWRYIGEFDEFDRYRWSLRRPFIAAVTKPGVLIMENRRDS